MSAEMIASVLFRFALTPLRELINKKSEEKALANSANWLAGRAWSPFGNGHTNVNSTGLQTPCIISSSLGFS
jgi:hypothetical protein